MKGLNGAFRCKMTQPAATQEPSEGALTFPPAMWPRTHCWASAPSSPQEQTASPKPQAFPQTPTVLAPFMPCQDFAPLVQGPRLSCFHQVQGPARAQAKETPGKSSGIIQCSLASHLCRQGHAVGRPRVAMDFLSRAGMCNR